MQASVILCFFQTTEYRTPRRNLVDTCRWLLGYPIEVIVVQGVEPGKTPVPLPANLKAVNVETKTAMFRKENLWNIGARHARSENLIFLDSDMWIDNPHWVEDTVGLLEKYDFVQPMAETAFHDRSGYETSRKVPVSKALRDGEKINMGVHHPGFGWCMKRRTFEKIGGFYDLCVSGAGDAAIAIAMAQPEQVAHLSKFLLQNDRFAETATFKSYLGGVRALNPKVSPCPRGTAHHRWHGTSMGRNYVDRDKLFPRLPNGEHDLVRLPNGVLEWRDPKGDKACREYFAARHEDGRTPWLFGIGVPKSGTNSLQRALTTIGLTARHLGTDEAKGRKDIHDLIEKNAKSGRKPLEGVIDVDAFVDTPIPSMFEALAVAYPDAKFVLTYRPPHDCALSWVRMIYYREGKAAKNMDDWPTGIKSYEGYARWAERHNSAVLDYFRNQPERLLILDCRDKDDVLWNSLRAFVGRPHRPMNRPYPHAFDHAQWK